MYIKLIVSIPFLLLATGCTYFDQTNEESIEPETEMIESPNEENRENGNLKTEIKESEEHVTEEEQELRRVIDSLPEESSSEDSSLILVNNWNELPDDYEVDLIEVEQDKLINSQIEEAYLSWNQAAREAGYNLFFASGYRSVERQERNYNYSINRFIDEGYSREEAVDKTQDYIAIPNHSEHHTGLAVDIVDQEWIAQGRGLEPEYDTQSSQQWLMETKTDFGFVLRYPEGKEEITGIQYEPWHFRYVGVENAEFMAENNLVLEEYIELLETREMRETRETKETKEAGDSEDS